jgi:hypothetical protein
MDERQKPGFDCLSGGQKSVVEALPEGSKRSGVPVREYKGRRPSSHRPTIQRNIQALIPPESKADMTFATIVGFRTAPVTADRSNGS